jgi:hypothetical protein
MLKNESTKAERLGYDKPSDKFLKFLTKHYKLVDYLPQNNNFVVFKEYFEKERYKNKINFNLQTDIKSPKRDLYEDNYNNSDMFKLERKKMYK